MWVGCGRVSTADQSAASQRDALVATGCDKVFIDKASGKLARRPELDKALVVARKGDQLVTTKLDRLGRSLEHWIALSNELQAKRVDLVVLDQGIDTSTALGRMFFHILGAIGEFEHALMSECTRDGLAVARARGRTGGEKAKLTAGQAKVARDMYDELCPRWAPGPHRGRDRRRVRGLPAHHLPPPPAEREMKRVLTSCSDGGPDVPYPVNAAVERERQHASLVLEPGPLSPLGGGHSMRAKAAKRRRL